MEELNIFKSNCKLARFQVKNMYYDEKMRLELFSLSSSDNNTLCTYMYTGKFYLMIE